MARQDCTTSGGDLVNTDDDNQHNFLLDFMDITGLKELTQVTMNYLTYSWQMTPK